MTKDHIVNNFKGGLSAWTKPATQDFNKSASFLNAALKGFGSHTASLLGGAWGTGGLLKAIGNLLGTHTKSVVNPKTGKLVKKVIPVKDLNGKLGLLDGAGQRLSTWGDSLTRWTEKLHKNYMRSVDRAIGRPGGHKSFGGRAFRFGLVGPAALGAPIAYTMWAEKPENTNKVLAQPAKALNIAYNASIPGLATTGIMKGMELYGKQMQNATTDGAAIASKLINYELANQNRLAYMGGVANPAGFARAVDDKVQAYIDQLKNTSLQ